ncbi:MAG TPA: DUF6717 family protein [Chitinophagaceae bacterium]|nr:DUF6717 family protein [Chitinophagaceae bacterium]
MFEGMEWYIDLPEYLLMVSGADTMLDIIAGEKSEVTLQINTEPFEGADELLLTERCDPIPGGGYFHLKPFENKKVNKDLWLCDVTRFVFGDIPKKIYVKKIQR